MTVAFYARPYYRFTEIKPISGERNFIEWIKSPIFSATVSAIEAM